MHNKFKITNIDTDKHLPQIAEWDKLFWNDNNYATTRQFLLDPMLDETCGSYDINNIDSIIANFGSPLMVAVQGYILPRNDKMLERRRVIVAEDIHGKVVGFALTSIVPQNGGKYMLSIDNILAHPHYLGRGVSSAILGELVQNAEVLYGEHVDSVTALVEEENRASLNLFKKFNFNLQPQNPSGLWQAKLQVLDNPKAHE